MVRFKIVAFSLLAVCYWNSALLSAAYASIALPQEIATLDSIAQSLRQPVRSKILEMRNTFTTQEMQPSVIVFFSGDHFKTAQIEMHQTLSSDSTQRVEIIRLTRADGGVLFEEKIETFGTGLILNSPRKRIYFEDKPKYGLENSNETSKRVSIRIDSTVVYEFFTQQESDSSGNTQLITQIYVGPIRILTLRDVANSSVTERVYSIEQSGETAAVGFFGGNWRVGGPKTTLKVNVSKPLNFLFENYRYFEGTNEIFGLNNFLQKFDQNMQKAYWVYLFDKPIQSLITYDFPKTKAVEGASRNSRFLNELIRIRTQLDLAKTDTTQLKLIGDSISSYIDAIQSNLLVIEDNRSQ